MHTPPRSPGGDKYGLGKTFSPKLSGSLLDVKPSPQNSMHDSDPDFSNITKTTNSDYPINDKWSKTDASTLAKAFKMG